MINIILNGESLKGFTPPLGFKRFSILFMFLHFHTVGASLDNGETRCNYKQPDRTEKEKIVSVNDIMLYILNSNRSTSNNYYLHFELYKVTEYKTIYK